MVAEKQPKIARIRVGLVSTDPLRIVGFQAIFEENERLELLSGPLPEVLRDQALHVVLICMQPSEALYDLIDTFRGYRPDIRLIIMSRTSEAEQISRMIGAGAKGILADCSSEKEIEMAIETVADGSIWAPRRVLAGLLDTALTPAAATAVATQSKVNITLTSRERDVLERLMAGATNRQIGATLEIEERTVKAHIAKLMRKVGVNNRTALTMQAITHQMIEGHKPAARRAKQS